MTLIVPPNRFSGLHGHSTFSSFDGLNYPDEHIDFVLENGGDSWALTDHGNANGHAHARKHFTKIKKSGRKYRQIFGVEMYFTPDLKQWHVDYETARDDAKLAREEAKKKEKPSDQDDGEDSEGHVIEDEEETKSVEEKPEWKKRYHLVVTARTQEGLHNIYRLVKRSYQEGFYKFPRIDFNMLDEHSEGLFISSACLGGIYSNRILSGQAHGKSRIEILNTLSNLTDRFVGIVGAENFALELQFNSLEAQHRVNDVLIEHANQSGVQLISTADSHYCRPENWEARELYKRLGWMGQKEERPLPKFDELKCELYPKNAQQMWDEYQKHKHLFSFYDDKDETVRDSIERTHDLVWNVFDDVWIDTKVKLPNYTTPQRTAFQQLADLVKDGMRKEGLDKKPEYVERAKHELEDIKHLGFENYFLVMKEVFDEAAKKTLFGAGRGSAPGSLVNYCLGITQLDPLKYNLLWERFLGRHRTSWPDCDSDVGDRDVLIDAARKLFGQDAVIPVSNFNTLKLKSLLQNVAKFFNVPHSDVIAVTKNLQEEVMPFAKEDDAEKSVFVLKHEDCLKYSPRYQKFMETYPEVKERIDKLFMQNNSLGRHAGGCIIAPAEQLEATMPLIQVKEKKSGKASLQTPWTEGLNFRNLEDNGFIKFDFLGLTLMEDIRNCISRILIEKGNKKPTFDDVKEFFDKNLNCRTIEPNDLKVYETAYCSGNWAPGLFQFTNGGARQFCYDAQPKSIEEIAAITAIFRPGPLKANVHNLYVDEKKKADAGLLTYPHPVIEEVLGETYGLLCFQEGFMLLAQKLSGFTAGESDALRKTLVKKSLDTIGKKGDEREIAKQKFIEGAKKLHNLDEKITEDLWEKISFFSVYGFNKSHSASYAIDSYYAAWLFTYYPKHWLATVLQSETGKPDAMQKTISEIKQLGYKFANVDINHSGIFWEFNEDIQAFVPPLSSVKGLGDTAMGEIVERRPFKNLDELLFEPDGTFAPSKMNKTSLANLIKIEALSSLEDVKLSKIENYKQLYTMLIEHNDLIKKGRKGMTPTQVKKAEKKGEIVLDVLDRLQSQTAGTEDWSRNEKVNFYDEICNSVPEDMLFPPGILQKLKEKNIPAITEIGHKEKALAWFLVREVKMKKTKTGKDYFQARVQDDKNKTVGLKIWGKLKETLDPFSLWLCEAEGDDQWGPSTTGWKMRKFTV